MNTGKIFVVAGPSGVGKDTIVCQIKERLPIFYSPISVTTRNPRPSEKDGVDYFFVSEEEFRQMIKNNEFLEFAHVHKWSFGTPLKPVEDALQKGQSVLMIIDQQGAKLVKKLMPKAILIYVQYERGQLEEKIKARLQQDQNARGEVSEKEIQMRIRTARKEEKTKHFFNYVVTNFDGHLYQTVQRVQNIILAELVK